MSTLTLPEILTRSDAACPLSLTACSSRKKCRKRRSVRDRDQRCVRDRQGGQVTNFIAEAMDHMLDDFSTRLDPFYQAGRTRRRGVRCPATLPSKVDRSPRRCLASPSSAPSERKKSVGEKDPVEKLRPTAKSTLKKRFPALPSRSKAQCQVAA